MIDGNELITLTSPRGSELFREALGYSCGVKLLQYYATQDNLAFCGPATLSMVLNALELPRPESPSHAPYKLFQQDHVFSGPAASILDRSRVESEGMDLQTLARVFDRYDLQVDMIRAEDHSTEAFRSLLIQSASHSGGRFVVANYHRRLLGQIGGGHISPLGGFHTKEDKVLVLDVSRYKHPAVWVPTEVLFSAMLPKDSTSNVSRGVVAVSVKRPEEHGTSPSAM